MTIMRIAVLMAFLQAGVLFFGADPSVAANGSVAAQVARGRLDVSAQAVVRPRRVPRIEVFPRPYNYPGPNAVRQCRAWYVQELRPSGPVVVPRMRCWWERGY